MTRATHPPGGPFLHHVCDTSLTGIPSVQGGTDITPEDLIVAFGHCQIDQTAHVIGPAGCPSGARFDNDHSGYPNDISGWNFNRNNNDPQTEQSIYGHFDGESAQLVGEGNNNFMGVGMCPLCRYVPIKAGDEAIDRTDRVAEAIVYAANIGVNVMDVSDASLGLTPAVQAAINYAYNTKGMVITWASNDFDSADHTDGMYYAHVWPGNSLTGDHSTRVGTTCLPPNTTSPYCPWVLSNNTFRSRSSLTSYGPHALSSVPNNDGSTSTGTPTQAGVAALVISAGLDAAQASEIARPLSADEVKQVVRSTVSPIDDPTLPFPGLPGATFNVQYGYGRPNVYRAVRAVHAAQIPPTVDILQPDWYQEMDPTTSRRVRIRAAVATRVPGRYTWTVEYGLGPQPLESEFVTIRTGHGRRPRTVSKSLRFRNIPSSFWGGDFAITS